MATGLFVVIFYFSGEMRTQEEEIFFFLLGKLEVDKGSCVKSILAGLKGKKSSVPQLH